MTGINPLMVEMPELPEEATTIVWSEDFEWVIMPDGSVVCTACGAPLAEMTAGEQVQLCHTCPSVDRVFRQNKTIRVGLRGSEPASWNIDLAQFNTELSVAGVSGNSVCISTPAEDFNWRFAYGVVIEP
jgi:hypothetical protein